jgi:hypothetical protein
MSSTTRSRCTNQPEQVQVERPEREVQDLAGSRCGQRDRDRHVCDRAMTVPSALVSVPETVPTAASAPPCVVNLVMSKVPVNVPPPGIVPVIGVVRPRRLRRRGARGRRDGAGGERSGRDHGHKRAEKAQAQLHFSPIPRP